MAADEREASAAADIEAIRQLKYRYVRLADALRFEDWGRECLTADCHLATREIGAHDGRDAIVAAVARSYGTAHTIHHVSMPDICLTGPDSATGVWALSDYCTWIAGGERRVSWGRGRYDEDYVRTGEGWRIRRSVMTREALDPPSGAAANPAALVAEIARLADIDAIRQLKARYVRFADAKRWDEWAALFAEGARIKTDGPLYEGAAAAVRAIAPALREAQTVHRLGFPEVTITGPDTAAAIWPMTDLVRGMVAGEAVEMRGSGHYHEEYVRTPDGWRIASIRQERQIVDVTPLAAPADGAAR